MWSANCRATASIAYVPLPGKIAVAAAPYTSVRSSLRSFITSTNGADM